MSNYVLIKVINISQEKVILKLNELNIDIYKLKPNNNDVIIKIKENDLEKITKYIRTWDFLIISFFIGLLLIFLMSNFIVEIRIIHEDEKLVELIENELELYGIKKFRIKKSYNEIQKIKKKIKNKNLDKIEWLEINKEGMKYIVRVEKRIINKEEKENDYCHVYAQKDGLISSMSIIKGEAKVGLNDYVKKGDLLLSGDILLDNKIIDKVCAKGNFYAEVWYEVNIKIPLNYNEKTKTGKKRKNIVVEYDGVERKIFKDRLENYVSSKKKVFDSLGIKIYIQTDEEVTIKKKKYTKQKALDKAILLAKQKVSLKLKDDEEIIKENILQKTIIDSTMIVDIFIVTKENIAKSIVAKEEDSDGSSNN